jgi:hypothetical protein
MYSCIEIQNLLTTAMVWPPKQAGQSKDNEKDIRIQILRKETYEMT